MNQELPILYTYFYQQYISKLIAWYDKCLTCGGDLVKGTGKAVQSKLKCTYLSLKKEKRKYMNFKIIFCDLHA
jgi:hypothetical protein